jgi:hypothetical protein
MSGAPKPRARRRWYRWHDRNGKCRVSIPVREADGLRKEERHSKPLDLFSIFYDGILWTLGYALMLVPLAFLFILPHVLGARCHWR